MSTILGIGVKDLSRGSIDPQAYSRWVGILQRCYSEKHHAKYPTYKDCFVSEEWLILSNFQNWLINGIRWQERDIDKDFLFQGNREYSADKCVLLPRYINSISAGLAQKGDLPFGVKGVTDSNKNPFIARCSNFYSGKREYLGAFPTIPSAHLAWQKAKLKTVDLAIETYSSDLGCDYRVVERLKNIAFNLQSDILQGRETKIL